MTKTGTAIAATNHIEVLRISHRLGNYGRLFARRPKAIRWNEYEPY